MTDKLTPTQINVLLALSDLEWQFFSETYPPIKKLMAMKLIDSKPQKYAGCMFCINQKGIEVLYDSMVAQKGKTNDR